jgi:hypothetical protein
MKFQVGRRGMATNSKRLPIGAAVAVSSALFLFK